MERNVSAGLIVWCLVLAFFGLNLALVAWVMLRLAIGGVAATLGFQAILLTTVWGILSLIP